MTSADQRIGRESAEEIKAHPFFAGWDWDRVRERDPPFVPELRSIIDTAYFPTDELEQVPQAVATPDAQILDSAGAEGGEKKDLAFVGYTFSRFDMLTRRGAL